MDKIGTSWKQFMNDGLIAEGLSPNLFHFTHVGKLLNILKTDQFMTSVAAGTGADQTDNEYFYYFSMARSKSSSYARSIGRGGATLNLDGRKLGYNHKGMPFNYWGDLERVGQSEAEDRILTNKPYIKNASKYIQEVHVSYPMDTVVSFSEEYMQRVPALVNKLSLLLQNKGIPLWIYVKENDWLTQNKRKAVSLEEFTEIIKEKYGEPPEVEEEEYVSSRTHGSEISGLVEYINALQSMDFSNLSKRGERYKDSWGGYVDKNQMVRTISADIHNMKGYPEARDALESLRQLMRKLKVKDVNGLADWIAAAQERVVKEKERKIEENKTDLERVVEYYYGLVSDFFGHLSDKTMTLGKSVVSSKVAVPMLKKFIKAHNKAKPDKADKLKHALKYRELNSIEEWDKWMKNRFLELNFNESKMHESTSKNMVTSFDFDSTLMLTRYDEDFGMVDAGPNMEMVNKLKKHKANGDTVYIVTARVESMEGFYSNDLEKGDDGYIMSVSEFVEDNSLPVDGVYFTNGKLKAKKLLDLDVDLHHDDDDDEVKACEEVGIDVIQVDADRGQ